MKSGPGGAFLPGPFFALWSRIGSIAKPAARAIAAACFCAASLGACSSGGGSSSSTTVPSPVASAQHKTPAACVLAQPADATQLFGRKATSVSVPNSAHAESVCGFSASTSADQNAIDNVTYSLLVYVYDGTTQYSSTRAKDAKAISGLGERGFMVVRGDLLTIAFVKSGETVVVAYSITGLAKLPNVSAASDDVVALAKNAASRM